MRYIGYILSENKILEKIYASSEKECEEMCEYRVKNKYKNVTYQIEDTLERYGLYEGL